jgi:16S rRNA G527 N7-methylase RsmG
MSVEQILQNEIEESKRCIDNADGVYKRDLMKRIELVNWVLQYIKNPNVCEIIGNKINETIDKINKADSIFEADPLDSELRILDWIFYQVL